MHLTDPTRDAQLSQELEASQQAFSVFQQAYRDYSNKATLCQQQREAAEAAENSARGFREQARALLRELLGNPSKKMQELRAEERSAYTLAEDYRSFIEELEVERDEALLAMQEAGRTYTYKRASALSTYAEGLLDQALDEIEPLLKAMAMKVEVLNRQGRFANWRQQGFESAQDVVMANIHKRLEQRLYGYRLDHDADPVYQALPWEHGLNEAQQATPMEIKKQRDSLEQRRAALSA
ncbi:hypothetical protein BI343_18065 [Chromobacterium amazonense]|uniref:hypothetical protein n=1 Tax=Chromobacterium amazonense TaxID=1382803 RepID=UPI0008D90B19|nr:hypothetical protein [Chromobacterium amazonense]OHX15860.1 hypothetical protein BI343_18065 [Chromobacterium amazonense]